MVDIEVTPEMAVVFDLLVLSCNFVTLVGVVGAHVVEASTNTVPVQKGKLSLSAARSGYIILLEKQRILQVTYMSVCICVFVQKFSTLTL